MFKMVFRSLLFFAIPLILLLPLTVNAQYSDEYETAKITTYSTLKITKKNTGYHYSNATGFLKDGETGHYGNGYYHISGFSTYPVIYSGEKFIVYTPVQNTYVQLTVYTETKPKLQEAYFTPLKVNKNRTPLYDLYTTKSNIVGYVDKGKFLTVVDERDGSGWYLVKNGSKFGWIRMDKVTILPVTTMRVTHSKTEVHTSNNSKSKTIKHLNINDFVSVVEENGNWYRINDGTEFYWILKNNISTNKTLQTIFEVKTTTNTKVYPNYNLDAKPKGTLKNGKTAEVVYSYKGRYKIKYKGSYAYISSKHMKRVK